MNDRLNQEPVPTSQAPAVIEANTAADDLTIFYKFVTENVYVYFVEVPYWSGLSFAITRLKEEFGIDVNDYDPGNLTPFVQKVEVVDASKVPDRPGPLAFVSRWS